MITSKIIVSVLLSVAGLLFFFCNKKIGKGAYWFYKKFYTEKNLIIMFKIIGVFLFIMGVILAVTE